MDTLKASQLMSLDCGTIENDRNSHHQQNLQSHQTQTSQGHNFDDGSKIFDSNNNNSGNLSAGIKLESSHHLHENIGKVEERLYDNGNGLVNAGQKWTPKNGRKFNSNGTERDGSEEDDPNQQMGNERKKYRHDGMVNQNSTSEQLQEKIKMAETQTEYGLSSEVFPTPQISLVRLPGQMDVEDTLMCESNRTADRAISRRRSRRIIPPEAIVPLPQWAKIALAEKGSGRTAGRLHGIVRAWSEALHLHRGVTTVAEAIDKIADVSKASRVQAFKYYRCLIWQNYPFNNPEARNIAMSKLRLGMVEICGQSYSLAPEMLKAMDKALGREESVQIARDHLASPEWRNYDRIWSGPASHATI
mmetsp:Transcript_19311/g.28541  ORF Transcript_19311/g.28541 Transcript_19311/m.28541 type:complete len:360 (+) Transcript_19311:93-1172(+)